MQGKNILREHKDYLIQIIPVLFGSIAGIIFFLFPPWGYSVGSLMFIFSIIYSIYILKKFDLRPDVTKAREDIKSMEEKYKKYVKEIEVLRTEYSDMKNKIDEAKVTLINLKMTLDKISHELNNLSSKLNNVEVIAKIGALSSGFNAVRKLIDDLQ